MISKTSRKIIFSLVAIVYLLLSFGFVYAGHEPGHAAIINGGGADPIIEQQADCNTDQGQADPNLCYTFVAPFIVADDGSGNKTLIKSVSASFTLGDYINRVIIVITGLAGVAAVIFLIVAGLQYITTENLGQKGQAKQRIQDALVGLLLVLAIGVILRTINPNLLNLNPAVDEVSLHFEADGLDPITIPGLENVNEENVSEYIFNNAPTITLNGNQGPQIIRACNAADIETIDVFGKKLRINKYLVPKIKAISQEWENRGGNSYYEVRSLGGYKCRLATGSSNKVSNHAYGLAIDVNPKENPFEKPKPDPITTDMTGIDPAFQTLWISRGFGWGGNWSSVADAMHFSMAPNEQGSGQY